MHLIIDTYNVLHVTGVLPPELAGIDLADLADLIRLSRYRLQPTMLICDGQRHAEVKAGQNGAITIRFAGKGRTADDLISQLVEQSTTPRRLSVVSSDRQVLRFARRRKCTCLTSEQFLQHLVNDIEPRLSQLARPRRSGRNADQKPRSVPTGSHVERWSRIFDVNLESLAAEAELRAEQMIRQRTPPREASKPKSSIMKTPPEPPARKKSKKSRPIQPLRSASKNRRRRSSMMDTSVTNAPEAVLPEHLIAEAEQLLNSSQRAPRAKRA